MHHTKFIMIRMEVLISRLRSQREREEWIDKQQKQNRAVIIISKQNKKTVEAFCKQNKVVGLGECSYWFGRKIENHFFNRGLLIENTCWIEDGWRDKIIAKRLGLKHEPFFT